MKYRNILVIFSLLVVFLVIVIGFVALLSPNDETYSMECHEHKDLATQKTWIRSSNITSYEDIPENEKNNLSNDTVESLRSYSPFWYNGTDYQNLSEREKDVFNTAIDTGARLNRNEVDRYVFTDSLILYEGDVYHCTGRRIGGA